MSDYLKKLRLQARLSQREAARLVYSATRTWQYYEAGKVDIPQHKLALFKLKIRNKLMTNDKQKTDIELIDLEAPIAHYSAYQKSLNTLRDKYQGVIYDVATTEGMDEAKKAREAIRKPRYELEHLRKKLKAPALEYSKRIDSEAKSIREQLEAIENPIHEQIVFEEKRAEREESERQAKILEQQSVINNYVRQSIYMDSKQIQAAIDEVKSIEIDPELYKEQLTTAIGSKNEALEQLSTALNNKLEAERQAALLAEQQAELEKLRKEREALEIANKATAATTLPRFETDTQPEPSVLSEVDSAESVEVAKVEQAEQQERQDDPFADLPKQELATPSKREIVVALANYYAISNRTAYEWIKSHDWSN